MSYHKGQKNHKCEFCGNSFSVAQYLKKHVQTVHESRKEYKCKSCRKSFYRVQSLKSHIHAIHKRKLNIGQKCESCAKFYFDARSLKRHINTVHGGHKDHKCESCCKSFTQFQHLKRHSTQFMKATNISNVKYVTNHLVHQECKTIENPDQKVHKCDIC